MLNYETFAQIDLRVGTIVSARAHPNADKLMILAVSLGTETRQIVAGIRQHYKPEDLMGTQVSVITNLEPRILRGETSQGMLLAASDQDGNVVLIGPRKTITDGSKIQ